MIRFLLDMPGMTGLELLGHADHYLEKPLRVDQLITTATALIGRGRQRWAGPYPDTPGRDTLPT